MRRRTPEEKREDERRRERRVRQYRREYRKEGIGGVFWAILPLLFSLPALLVLFLLGGLTLAGIINTFTNLIFWVAILIPTAIMIVFGKRIIGTQKVLGLSVLVAVPVFFYHVYLDLQSSWLINTIISIFLNQHCNLHNV